MPGLLRRHNIGMYNFDIILIHLSHTDACYQLVLTVSEVSVMCFVSPNHKPRATTYEMHSYLKLEVTIVFVTFPVTMINYLTRVTFRGKGLFCGNKDCFSCSLPPRPK